MLRCWLQTRPSSRWEPQQVPRRLLTRRQPDRRLFSWRQASTQVMCAPSRPVQCLSPRTLRNLCMPLYAATSAAILPLPDQHHHLLRCDGHTSAASSSAAGGSCSEGLSGSNDAGYRGCQSVTRSGKTCQAWSLQLPHAHSNTPSNRPHAGLEGNNYCRNPDGSATIWCYTADSATRWEYCDPKSTAAPTGFAPCSD